MPDRPNPLSTFLQHFTVLKGAVRELWIVFGVKFIGFAAYGVMNSTLVLWLSSDLGYSDAKAGYLVAMWSTVMTLMIVMVGSLTDAIGLRKTFLFGVTIALAARVIMTFGETKALTLAGGFFPLALGEALLGPVMVAAIKRYATTAQRSISFSIFYAMMNAGLFVANNLFDLLRTKLGEYGNFTVPVLGTELSTYRTLFLVSTLLTVPNVILLWGFFREGIEVTDEGVTFRPKPPPSNTGLFQSTWDVSKKALVDTARIFAGLWGQTGFYKFLIFLSLATFVRLIFFHMYYTYPKFGIRELGEGAPVGRLFAINSALIIFLVPLVGAFSQKISAYRMVLFGTFIAAGSVFIMACPPQWFEPQAQGALGHWVGSVWLGLKGTVHPYYVMIFLFVILLSCGEAFYSPRLYEYAAAIAPKGQEASYMAMSFLPFFLAKFIAGMFSGKLLEAFCPANGPRQSNILWLIIALVTAIGPIGLLAFRRRIQVREEGRDE